MATLQELESAFLKADAAGDSTAASVLAKEIRNLRGIQSTGLGASYQPRTSIDPENPSPLVRAGRGFMDIPESVRYIASGGQRDPVEDENEALYQKGRGKDAGFDAARFGANTAGSVAFTGPVAAAARYAGVVGPIARAAVGATQGAMQGALTHTPEGSSKLAQAGIGAGGGAIAPFVR
jgi:hypothetical protein